MIFLDPLQALSKTLTVDELFYLKGQFSLLEPDRNGCITLDNIRMVGSLYSSDCPSIHCKATLLTPPISSSLGLDKRSH
jgi:hypothetical protein